MDFDADKEIMGSYEVKTHFAQVLDRVGRGETITVTRHGKAVARIIPEPQPDAPSLSEWLIDGPRVEEFAPPPRDDAAMRGVGL